MEVVFDLKQTSDSFEVRWLMNGRKEDNERTYDMVVTEKNIYNMQNIYY